MRSLKISWVILFTLGLIGLAGDSYFVTAGGDPPDPPHETHLTHARGPGLDTDCTRCHTGTPAYSNVDWDTCNPCHSPGGLYDKDTYPDLWAVNNWENIGSSAGANESMIYEGGALKAGKEKWCATCHDEDET
jgi:hypothetical protein